MKLYIHIFFFKFQVDRQMEASVRAFWPESSYVNSEKSVQKNYYMQASSRTEPIVGSLVTSLESPVWNVSSFDSYAESLHGVITEEPNNEDSLSDSTDNGTGITIRDHQPRYAANANRLVSQGHASRRIRLQIGPGQQMFSVANESGSDMGHNEDDTSESTVSFYFMIDMLVKANKWLALNLKKKKKRTLCYLCCNVLSTSLNPHPIYFGFFNISISVLFNNGCFWCSKTMSVYECFQITKVDDLMVVSIDPRALLTVLQVHLKSLHFRRP